MSEGTTAEAVSLSVTVLPVTTDGNIDVLGADAGDVCKISKLGDV